QKLPNPEDISLTWINVTFLYNEVIVSHLQRMINLKKLALYFVSTCHETLIDGNNLKQNIISHMPRLKPQTFKQEQDSNNNSRKLSVIEYSHLITLGLINVHDDYAEQFLLNTKTCLSNYIRLEINYDQLQRVIENFTSK
ncbi:unnamed protein product, partial [Rotaria sp. Silwood2]